MAKKRISTQASVKFKAYEVISDLVDDGCNRGIRNGLDDLTKLPTELEILQIVERTRQAVMESLQEKMDFDS